MYGTRSRIGYTSPPLVSEIFPYEFYQMAPEGVGPGAGNARCLGAYRR